MIKVHLDLYSHLLFTTTCPQFDWNEHIHFSIIWNLHHCTTSVMAGVTKKPPLGDFYPYASYIV
ncbi:hypothetical protein AB9M62_43405 [Bacillales bacterium AN1005]